MNSEATLDNEYLERLKYSSAILKKAKELGASLAGICDLADLKESPSFTLAPKLPQADVGSRKSDLGLEPGEVYWPENTESALVIGFEHPKEKPDLDWWFGKKEPSGNRVLANIINEMTRWIESNYPITTYHCPYHVEKGGIFLKDAAYYAGLGCIGKNNLLVTPEFGPRIRLRAMLISVKLPSTGPSSFDPCKLCNSQCLKPCPGKAFQETIYTAEEMGQVNLPGRVGNYSRDICNHQMNLDSSNAEEKTIPEIGPEPVKIIKYCRNCEFTCPVGS